MAIKVQSTTVIDDNKLFLPVNTFSTETTATISSGVLAIDLNTATAFDVQLTSNITSLTIANVQANGRTSSFILMFTADGTPRTVVWPASFKWPQGLSPTLTSTNGKKDVFTFYTVDGGTTWISLVTGQNI